MSFRFPARGAGDITEEQAAGYQPLDDDLTYIADQATAPFGRSMNDLTNAENARSYLGVTPLVTSLETRATSLEDQTADLLTRIAELEGGQVGGNLLFLDTFTGANGTIVSEGPPGGSIWYSDTGTMFRDNNQGYASGATWARFYTQREDFTQFTLDVDITIDEWLTPNGTDFAGIKFYLLRHPDDLGDNTANANSGNGPTIYVAQPLMGPLNPESSLTGTTTGTGKTFIQKKGPGTSSYTVLDQTSADTFPATEGQSYHVKFEVTREAVASIRIKMWRDDVLISNVVDDGSEGGDAFIDGGAVGVRGDDVEFHFDNFRVETAIGAYTGGGGSETHPSIATWVDDYSGDLSNYTEVGEVELTDDDQLSLAPLPLPGSYIETEDFYSWPDGAAVYYTVDDPSVGVTTFGGVEVRSSENNIIRLTVNAAGSIWYRLVEPGGVIDDVEVDASWDDEAQRAVRIIRDGSNWEIQASDDGSTWGSVLATVAIPSTFDTSRVTGRQIAAYFGTEPDPRPFLFGSLNTFDALPEGDPPPDPGDGVLLREYNFDSSANPFPILEQPSGSTSLSRVTSPNPPGDRTYAGLFRHNSNSERIEGTDYSYQFFAGDEVWIGMSLYLPSSISSQFDGGHHTIMQFKQGPNTGGGGPQELDYRKDGGGGWPDGLHFGGETVVLEASAYNTWHNLQFRCLFGHSDGELECWHNDVLLFNDSNRDTLGGGPDYCYIKFGNYGNYTSWPVDLYISNIRFGTTRAIVRPPGT